MKYLYTTLILSIFTIAAQAQNCSNLDKYYEKMRAAESYIIAGNYSAAQDNYNAAKIYCEDKADDIEKAKENLFKTIDGLRLEAERQRQIADEKTLESQKQKEIAESKTLEVERQKEIVESKVREAEQNSNLFKSYVSIQMGYLSENDLYDEFVTWTQQSDREEELDAILYLYIYRSESIQDDKELDSEYWRNLIPQMNVEQKARLLDILSRETEKLYGIRKKYGSPIIEFELLERDPERYLQEKSDSNISHLIRLGRHTRQSKNRPELAIQVFEKVLELDSRNTEAMEEIAHTYSSTKKYPQAYQMIQNAISISSKDYSLWYNLSFYSLFINKPQEAVNAAQTTLKLDPEALGVETNLALGYLLQNNYSEAEKIYLKWKGKKFTDSDDRLCDEHFVQDVLDLEAYGVYHPDFEKVKLMFRK